MTTHNLAEADDAAAGRILCENVHDHMNIVICRTMHVVGSSSCCLVQNRDKKDKKQRTEGSYQQRASLSLLHVAYAQPE